MASSRLMHILLLAIVATSADAAVTPPADFVLSGARIYSGAGE